MPDLKYANHHFRRASDFLATFLTWLAAVVVLLPLLAIFGYLIYRGIGSLNGAFFTQIPKPVGEMGGGMANAIVGSGVILGIASLIGIPLGMGAGIYLAEYGRGGLGNIVRFTADVLNGIPSIVMGIAIYALVVVRQKHFSAFSGVNISGPSPHFLFHLSPHIGSMPICNPSAAALSTM